MRFRLDGRNPLAYMGVRPNAPALTVIYPYRPTPQDGFGWSLGTVWVIPLAPAGSPEDTPSEEIWHLVGQAEGINTWFRITGSTGNTAITVVNQVSITTTGAGTYTPSAGIAFAKVECIGGGGGSAGVGCKNLVSNNVARAYAGGGGAYSCSIFTAAELGSSQPYVVGAGGTGGIGGDPDPGQFAFFNGTAGQDTTFGSGSLLMTAGGGQSSSNLGSQLGGVATGGQININGQDGIEGLYFNDQQMADGFQVVTYPTGGASALGYGFGGQGRLGAPNSGIIGFTGSVAGSNYGGGASGVFGTSGAPSSTGTANGAAGGDGLIIITEYAS